MTEPVGFEVLERLYGAYQEAPDPIRFWAELEEFQPQHALALRAFLHEAEAADAWFSELKPGLEVLVSDEAETEPLASALAQDLSGQRLAHFEMLQRIGQGGMGAVYKAKDTRLDRFVAIKVIRGLHHDAQTRERFRREAIILSKMEHPNICRVYDFVELADCDLLVMEFLEGQNLKQALAGEPSQQRRLEWAIQIGTGLCAAHELQIVHRDLKPENVMITRAGVVKVLDFGLARSADPVGVSDASGEIDLPLFASNLTVNGTIMGTPMFMSPEQARGEHLFTSSDMYSFGLLLFWLFSGQYPFPKGNLVEMLFRVQQGQFDASSLGHREIRRLVKRMTQMNANIRPTAEDSIEKLKWILTKPLRQKVRISIAFAFMVLAILTLVAWAQNQRAQRAMREAQSARDRAQAVKGFLKEILKAPDPWETGNRDILVRDVLSHADRELRSRFPDYPLYEAEIRQTIGATYFGLGEDDLAWQYTNQALVLLEPNDPDNIQVEAMVVRAEIQIRRGQSQAALQTLDEVASLVPADQPELDLRVRSVRANAYLTNGEMDRAANYIRETQLSFAHFLLSHPQQKIQWDSLLASVLWSQGKLADAAVLQEALVADSSKEFGLDHAKTLTEKANLGTIYSDLGRYGDALIIEQDLLKKYQEILGPSHETTLNHIVNLSYTLRNSGDPQTALTLLLDHLKLAETHLSADSPICLTLLEQLGNTYLQLERGNEAEGVFRNLLERRRQVNGQDHRFSLTAMHKLAQTLFQNGHLEEAGSWADQATKLKRATLGVEHAYTLNSQFLLGQIRFAQARYANATSLFAEILAVQTATDPQDPKIQRTQEWLEKSRAANK